MDDDEKQLLFRLSKLHENDNTEQALALRLEALRTPTKEPPSEAELKSRLESLKGIASAAPAVASNQQTASAKLKPSAVAPGLLPLSLPLADSAGGANLLPLNLESTANETSDSLLQMLAAEIAIDRTASTQMSKQQPKAAAKASPSATAGVEDDEDADEDELADKLLQEILQGADRLTAI